jgi:hypothetical protein
MDAIRCLECGDVRWSLIGIKGTPPDCAMCGGKTAPERRRPAASTPDVALAERRQLAGARDDGSSRPTA